MVLRRGFKAEAERVAEDVRRQLGLSRHASVTPESLANLLGVEIRAGDDLVPRSRFIKLEQLQEGSFSACTFHPTPERVVVVFNPLSTEPRRTSDLAHELSHILLEHELNRVESLGGMTFLSCDVSQEDEAAWLSGCLLLPRPLLLRAIQRGETPIQIAAKHGVSEQMAQYRINVTGVLRQNRVRSRKL